MPRSKRRRSSSLLAFAAALTLLLGFAADAGAEQGDVAAYKKAVARGAAEFDAGEYAAARTSFEAAYAIHPDPVLLFNIASTYRREGDRERAIAAYQRFLREADGDDPRRTLARETIDALEDAIAAERAARDARTEVARTDAARRRAEAEAAERRKENERLRAALTERAKRRRLAERRAGEAPDSDRGETWRHLGIGFGVAGGLSLVVSLYDARRASRAEQSLELATSWDAAEEELYRQGQEARRRALLAGIGGAALVTTGAVFYLIGHRAGSQRVEVAPTISDRGAGAMIRGQF